MRKARRRTKKLKCDFCGWTFTDGDDAALITFGKRGEIETVTCTWCAAGPDTRVGLGRACLVSQISTKMDGRVAGTFRWLVKDRPVNPVMLVAVSLWFTFLIFALYVFLGAVR